MSCARSTGKKKPKKTWIKLRKRLRKQAQRVHGYRAVEWVGGKLFLMDTVPPTLVPDVEEVPKPGRPAIGLAAHPAAGTRAPARARQPEVGYCRSGYRD